MQISIDRLCDAKGEEDEEDEKVKKKTMGWGREGNFFILSPFLFLHESHFKVSILVLLHSFFYPF